QSRRQAFAIAAHGSHFRLFCCVDRSRMGARARLHRSALESDRLYLVWRISRRDTDAAERRRNWHLRAELPDGTCRLAARPFRDNLAEPAFDRPALRPGDWSGPLDSFTAPLACRAAGYHTDCRNRISLAHRPAVDPANDEVGAGR